MEWLMIGVSQSKVHTHASGVQKWFNTKIHLAVDGKMLCRSRLIMTEGDNADCKQVHNLIGEMKEEWLLADIGCNVDYIVDHAIAPDMQPIILFKKNSKEQRSYDRDLYKLRYIIENTFLHLKRYFTTRYAENYLYLN